MGILLWIGIGLGIAFVANWEIPSKNRNGTMITFASATIGAIAGGIASAGSSAEPLATINVLGLFCATGVACLALLGVQLLKTTLYIEH